MNASARHNQTSFYEHPGTDWDAVGYNITANRTQGGNDGPNAYEFTTKDALYYGLASLALLFFCFCSRSRIPDEQHRIAAAERSARWRAREERKDRMSDEAYRRRLVLKGLVVKKVLDDANGQLTLGDDDDGEGDDPHDHDGDSHSGTSLSIDSTDENASTCVICLELFRVGDVVAWSKTLLDATAEETCNHVFHKECIVSWLMSPTHDECPSCRAPIVFEEDADDDEISVRTTNSEDDDDSISRSRRSVAFVIMRGLVSRVRRASYSLIGQSIDIAGGDDLVDRSLSGRSHDDHDVENGPKAPPSPIRRVLSLEGSSSTQVRRRNSLRRRVSTSRASLSSHGDHSSSSATDLEIPVIGNDVQPALPSAPAPDTSATTQSSPLILRRVLSDTRVATPGHDKLLGSRRRFLPLRPRGSAAGARYHALVPHTPETSERSLDDEDEILIQQSHLRDGDENVIFEDEPC